MKLIHLKVFLNIALILSILMLLLSCTPSAPYEIRSPCVSIDNDDHPYAITPCPMRPVNENQIILI